MDKNTTKPKEAKSFIRFCVVGVGNTATDFGLFMLLHYIFHLEVIFAHIIGFSFAACQSYLLHKHFTFKGHSRDGHNIRPFYKFLAVTTSSMALSSVIIIVLEAFMWAFLAKILTLAITLLWNYSGYRLFVFRFPGNDA